MGPYDRRKFLVGATSMLGLSFGGCLGTETSTEQWESDQQLATPTATQYHDPNCGCCSEYATYLDSHLDGNLEVIDSAELRTVKQDSNIPESLWSCHTVEYGEYIVEGHIPVEVISQLHTEQPAIDGIALPDMPSGSPGMSGNKDGIWEFYQFEGGEAGSTFMEL